MQLGTLPVKTADVVTNGELIDTLRDYLKLLPGFSVTSIDRVSLASGQNARYLTMTLSGNAFDDSNGSISQIKVYSDQQAGIDISSLTDSSICVQNTKCDVSSSTSSVIFKSTLQPTGIQTNAIDQNGQICANAISMPVATGVMLLDTTLSNYSRNDYVSLSSITQQLGDSREKVVSQWLLSSSLSNVQVDLSPLYRILVGQLEFLNRVV